MAQRTCVCPECGADFTTTHPRKIYCSKPCTVTVNNRVNNAKSKVAHEPRVCPECRETFTPRRSDTNYCSTACGSRARYVPASTGRQVICSHCLKPFAPQRSDASFCSNKCYMQDRKGVPAIRHCLQCDSDISDLHARRRYCVPCAEERLRTVHRRRYVPRPKREPTPISAICVACGSVFAARSARARTCSSACHQWSVKRPGEMRDLSRMCPMCSIEFIASDMHTQFCGPQCRAAASKRRVHPIKAAYVRYTTCQICDGPMPIGKIAGSKYCSARCANFASNSLQPRKFFELFGRTCERCGEELAPKKRLGARFCTARCQVLMNQEIRRARKRGLPWERVSRADIFERDEMTCHLCGIEILSRPTIDHVVPIARPDCPGHVWENLAAAHGSCNTSKRDRVRPADYDLYEALCKLRGVRSVFADESEKRGGVQMLLVA